MSVSGFNDKFLFYGFLPKTENQLEKVLSSLSKNLFTQIFFLPSKKLNFYLKGFKKFFSCRQIMIAKEITKIHEAFIRAEIDDLKIFKSTVKGELTVVISEKNFTRLNTWLRAQGITVEEVPYAEIAKQEGLLRCSTMPLIRD